MNDTATDTKIIDGKAFAAGLRAKVAARVEALKSRHGIEPGLAVVLAGEHPASQVYVRNKARQTREAGMQSFEHRLPAATSQDDLLALVRQLNRDSRVSGILVQLPLPEQIGADAVIATIDPAKDVDGFHTTNAGLLAVGGEGMVPCTPLGCLMLLKDRLKDLAGARALVLGRSNIVGKPMAQLLIRESCTVTVAHSRTRDLAAECRRADILVAAVGRPRMVPGDWIRPGRHGHRRRHQPGRRGERKDEARRRRGLRERPPGRRGHHPGAWRGRADDHRLPVAQYRARRVPPARGRGPGGLSGSRTRQANRWPARPSGNTANTTLCTEPPPCPPRAGLA